MNLCQYLRVKSSILAPCAGVERRETNVRDATGRTATPHGANRQPRPHRRSAIAAKRNVKGDSCRVCDPPGRPRATEHQDQSRAHVSCSHLPIQEIRSRSSYRSPSLLTLRASLVSRSPDSSPLTDSSSPRLIYTPSTRNGIAERESRGLEAPRARLAPSPRAAVSRDAAGGGAWGAGARLTAGPPASQQHG